MRRVLRWLALTVATSLALAIVAGVVGEFFIEWARQEGWYDNPSQRVDAAITAFGSVVTQTWFLVLAGAFAGLTLGLWADLFLRRRESPTTLAKKPLKVIKLQDFANKHVIIDGGHFISCKFHHCTMEYNGGDYELTTCDMRGGNIKLISKNEAIVGSMFLLKASGIFAGRMETLVVLPDDAEGAFDLNSITLRKGDDQSAPSRTD